MEHYEFRDGRYVLYSDGMPILHTGIVSIIVDAGEERIVTHGCPASVRRELDELRAAARRSGVSDVEQPWVLIESCPRLDALNAVIAGRLSPMDLHSAPADALEMAREWIARAAWRSRTAP